MSLTLLGIFDDIINSVMYVVGMILWGLADIFFVLIDLIEELFRKFAGLDVVYTSSGEAIEGDIVLYLLSSTIVQDIFFSIMILGFFLLIIFTIFAIVKNQYTDKPKPVSGIISNAFKGLLMYILVPAATVVCLTVGNIVLQAIDGATRTQTSGTASDMLFITAAYNANMLRDGDLVDQREELAYLIDQGRLNNIMDDLAEYGIYSSADAEFASSTTIENIATLIDEKFVAGELIANKWSYSAVANYYQLIQLSYITVWVGGGFMIYALFMISWGLLNRIFKMVITYCMTPAFMAMYPLDEGKALKSWAGDFAKNASMAYVAVGVLNIFYSVLPFVRNINIYSTAAGVITNLWIRLLITISGYLLVKNLISTISGWIGTGNAYDEGKSAKDAISKPIKATVGGAVKGVAGATGAYTAAKKAGAGRGEKFYATLLGAYKGTGLSDKFDPTKAVTDAAKASKEGGEFYRNVYTNSSFNKDIREEREARFTVADAINKEKKEFAKQQKIIEAWRDQLINEAIAKGATNAEIQAIRDNAELQLYKFASEQTIGKILGAKDMGAIDMSKKELDTDKSRFAPAQAYYEAVETEKALYEQIFGDDGLGVSDHRLTVKSLDQTDPRFAQYEKLAESITLAQQEQGRAVRAAENLSKTDAEVKKALEKVFAFSGDKIVDPTGNVDIYSREVSKAIDDLAEREKNINEKIKDVIRDVASKMEQVRNGNITPDQAKTIAEGLKNQK